MGSKADIGRLERKAERKEKKGKETEWKMEIEIIGRGRREGEMSRGAH